MQPSDNSCWSFLGGKKASFERGDETIRHGSHESHKLACEASVSNRVIARKLEQEQKKESFLFFLLSSQLSRRNREETLATQASHKLIKLL